MFCWGANLYLGIQPGSSFSGSYMRDFFCCNWATEWPPVWGHIEVAIIGYFIICHFQILQIPFDGFEKWLQPLKVAGWRLLLFCPDHSLRWSWVSASLLWWWPREGGVSGQLRSWSCASPEVTTQINASHPSTSLSNLYPDLALHQSFNLARIRGDCLLRVEVIPFCGPLRKYKRLVQKGSSNNGMADLWNNLFAMFCVSLTKMTTCSSDPTKEEEFRM